MRIFLLSAFLSLMVWGEPTYLSFPSDVSWKSQSSNHFQIVYREGQQEFASRTLRAAERAHSLLESIFPESPPLTFIVLADFQDSLNGYSLNFPFPHFVVFATPPSSTGELASLDSWLESVVLHEYVHTLHMYPATGAWKWMRSVFGTWVVPNGMLPQHLHEGLATFLETELSRGGRGKGSYFNMLSRKAVESETWGSDFVPLDLLDGSSSRYPHGSSPYFFGYYFYQYLWKEKNKKGIYDLTLSGSSNWPYLIDIPFKEVYDKSLAEIWKNVFSQVGEQKKEDLKKIRSESLSQISYLTQTKFQKKDVVLSSDKSRIAFLSYTPSVGATLQIGPLEALSSGAQGFPIDVSDSGGLCWNEKSGLDTFVLSTRHSRYFYSLNRLSQLTPPFNKPQFIKSTEGFIDHVREIDCDPTLKTLLVYQESGGKGRITQYEGELLNSEHLRPRHSWEIPQGTWVSALSWGDPAYFLLRNGSRTLFYRWKPPLHPELLGDIEGHAYQLKRSEKGALYLITALSGRDEIWQWEPSKNQLIKTIATVGGFNSFALHRDHFIVSSYEQGGYDLAKALPIEKAQKTALSKSDISFSSPASSGFEEKEYSPGSTLIPRTWVPSALIVPYGLQVGAWIPMFDLTQRHFYDINLGIDRRDTISGSQLLPFLSASYGFRFGQSSVAQANSYFLPSFLTIARSFFKRWGTSLSYAQEIPGTFIQARFSSIFRRVEDSLLGPANQSVGLGLEFGWASRIRAGALDAPLSSGIRLTASHQQFLKTLGSQDNFFSTLATFEGTVNSLLWKNASWNLKLRQGYTEGTPLYNSYFEGGGELMFSQGRGFFLNRGYLQGSFAGRRIFGGNLEFQFPMGRVDRGWNLWPIFLQNLSGALVLDTTSYDLGVLSKSQKTWLKQFLWSTGVEIKTHWRFFYYLPTELRFGAYRGLSEGGEPFYFTVGLEAAL